MDLLEVIWPETYTMLKSAKEAFFLAKAVFVQSTMKVALADEEIIANEKVRRINGVSEFTQNRMNWQLVRKLETFFLLGAGSSSKLR